MPWTVPSLCLLMPWYLRDSSQRFSTKRNKLWLQFNCFVTISCHFRPIALFWYSIKAAWYFQVHLGNSNQFVRLRMVVLILQWAPSCCFRMIGHLLNMQKSHLLFGHSLDIIDYLFSSSSKMIGWIAIILLGEHRNLLATLRRYDSTVTAI